MVLSMLVLSGFFSGLEIAFLSANKLRIELKSQDGHRWAKILSNYMNMPSKFIATLLIGNNIALVIYGIVMGNLLSELLIFPQQLAGLQFLLVTILSTIIVLVTAEFLPKALFRINPSGFLATLIYPFQIFYWLLWPVVQLIVAISRGTFWVLFKEKFVEDSRVFSKVDLNHFIASSYGDEENEIVDTEVLKNALEFNTVQVRNCMIPRTLVKAVDISASIEELAHLFQQTNHSKILIFKEDIDQIIGYVHQIELFKNPKTIQSILMPILITNESKNASELLNEMGNKRKSIALVVDEYGGTAGIVTVEDILEEIFGEIEDEHDVDQKIEKELNKGLYLFSSILEIDHLNDVYKLGLPVGDYETLGGFIVSKYEKIPKRGEKLLIDGFEIEVVKANQTSLEQVKLKKN
ncbi:MAG: hemolysin [Bacteroidetes bacterium MED-G17]|nr:MAG: hypothetical protein CBB99_06755 [Bacteroidetes bacterium TMED39]PDH51736.1 MAG: hemolysin [Bacteroidetes bacterium MED-G17]CAI8314218.1 MAG: Hemolysin C [Bacteroidetes bacterium MED-G17]